MPNQESFIDYYNHYLLSAIVSAVVTVFCFWLGILWDRSREKRKANEDLRKQKESFVISLWEVGLRCQKLQDDGWQIQEMQKQDSNRAYQKGFLNLFQTDFYEVAKANNFFDFDYSTKGEILILKENISAINEIIKLFNSIHGKFNDEECLKNTRNYEAQVLSVSKTIDESYKKLLTSKYLARVILKHIGKLDEYKDDLKVYEKSAQGNDKA